MREPYDCINAVVIAFVHMPQSYLYVVIDFRFLLDCEFSRN